MVLGSPERRIILDTKFSSGPFAGRFGSRKIDSSHLYQLLTYRENRPGTMREGPRHEGMLLYPTIDETMRVEVELGGFRVQARSVDLNQPWRRVHDEMLDCIGARQCELSRR